MADALIQSTGDISWGAGSTLYVPYSGKLVTSTVEDELALKLVSTDPTFDNLTLVISSNRTAFTLTMRDNTGAGFINSGPIITTPSAPVGQFQDTTHSGGGSTFGRFSLKGVGGTGGNTQHVYAVGMLFHANGIPLFNGFGTTPSLFMSAGSTSISAASTTTFVPVSGQNASTAEAVCNLQMKTPGVFSGLNVYVTANSRTSTTTFRSRINSVNGNQIVSFTSGATGLISDTTHTDTLAVNNLINYSVTTGTGAGTFTWIQTKSELNTDNSKSHYVTALDSGASISGSGVVTRVLPLNGAITLQTTANETLTQITGRVAQTVSDTEVHVSVNSRASSATTFAFRKNGTNSAVVVSVPASSIGWFADTTHTTTTSVSDLLNYSVVTGSGTGTVTFVSISSVFHGTTDWLIPIPWDGDPNACRVGITDTVTARYGQYRACSDTVGITDTIRISTSIHLTDTVGITETAATDLDLRKTLTNTVGITDALTPHVALSLEFANTVNITETIEAEGPSLANAFDEVGITAVVDTFSAELHVLNEVGIENTLATHPALRWTAPNQAGIIDQVTTSSHIQIHLVGTVGVHNTLLSGSGRQRPPILTPTSVAVLNGRNFVQVADSRRLATVI